MALSPSAPTFMTATSADATAAVILLDSRLGPLRRPPSSSSASTKHRRQRASSSSSSASGSIGSWRRTFWRRAKWSPDGTHVLLQGEHHSLETLRLSRPDSVQGEVVSALEKAKLEEGQLPVYHAPAPLLDAAWYPYAQASSPSSSATSGKSKAVDATTEAEEEEWTRKQTWCFLSSVRNVPVRLVDADSGQSRTSYGVMDHVERFVAPTAMEFSPYGDRFYAGHDSYLTTHELASPGLNTHTHMALAGPAANSHAGPLCIHLPTKSESGPETTTTSTTSKRSKLRLKRAQRRQIASVQQRGIISSLSVCLDPGYHLDGQIVSPEEDGRMPEVLAMGTFSGNVGLYALGRGSSAGECCVAGWKEGQGTGISQVAFHPGAPNLLFVKSRRSDLIKVYDVRLLCGCLAVDFQSRAQASFSGRTSGTLVAILHPSPARKSLTVVSSQAHSNGTERSSGDQPGAQDVEAPKTRDAEQRPLQKKKPHRRRKERTQQRRFFDIDASGRWLCAGDASGTVRVWDIDIRPPAPAPSAAEPSAMTTLLAEYEARLMSEGGGDAQMSDKARMHVAPVLAWSAHQDPITCTTFHPTRPLILTLAGSRRQHGVSSSATRRSASPDPSSSSSSSSEESADSDFSTSSLSSSGSGRDRSSQADERRAALGLWHVPDLRADLSPTM
ncbi:hypothetical protein V8E36_004518 [Tilletia maclaganii]